MPDKGVFVDDEDGQYAALLSTRNDLDFVYQTVLPITDQALAIRGEKPVVVALDYRLDEVTPDVPAEHTYKGSGLAQLLRDAAIANPAEDFAIVLVSGEMKLEALYAPDKTAHDLFDRVYTKEEVTDNRDRVRTELRALRDGYLSLRSLAGIYDPVVVLQAPDDSRERVLIQEIATAFQHASAPHIVSKIVLRNFIGRPGLLVDDNDAASVLGLHPESFGAVVEWLTSSGALYTGVFAGGWRRWWAHRLETVAAERLGRTPLAFDAHDRAENLSASLELALQPARSPWNGSDREFIAFACASCGRPAEMRHSLAAFDPRAPRYAARRRICWDCIQTDQYLQPSVGLLVEESDQPLVDDIKRRDRKA